MNKYLNNRQVTIATVLIHNTKCNVKSSNIRELTMSLSGCWMWFCRSVLTSVFLQPFFHVYIPTEGMKLTFAQTYINEKQIDFHPLKSHETVDCFRHDAFKRVSSFPTSAWLSQPFKSMLMLILFCLQVCSKVPRIGPLKMK